MLSLPGMPSKPGRLTVMRLGQSTALSSGTIVVPKRTNYVKGKYGAYISPWGSSPANGQPDGTWDQNWTITPSSFPNKTVLDWHYEDGEDFPSVAGYSKITYMNGDAAEVLVGQIVPRQYFNITELKVPFDWQYSGSVHFNTLAETWAAPVARAGGETNSEGNSYFELGFIAYTDQPAYHNGGTVVGTFVDPTGTSWDVRWNPISGFPAKSGSTPGKYITAYNPGKYVGTIDYKAYVDWLVARNLMTGAEWYNGDDFGIEQLDGGGTGQWKLNSLSHTYTHVTNNNLSYIPGTTINSYPLDLGNGAYWVFGAVTPTSGQADAYGGNNGVLFLETTATDYHNLFKSGVATVSREADYLIAVVAKLVGRTYCSTGMSKNDYSAAATQQFRPSTYETISSAGGVTNVYGGFTVLQTQVVDMQAAGFKGIFLRVRKPAGVSSANCYFEVQADNGSTRQYTGDVTKGFALSEYRIVQDPRLVIAGTPGNGAIYTAYSYTPTTFRGGTGTVTWAVSSGALPTGLTLNTATGQITGTPESLGTSSGIVLTATDSLGVSASIGPFAITVGTPANLLQPNFSNAGVTKTNCTIANGNTATQQFLETVTNGAHSVGQTISGQGNAAGKYRLEVDIAAVNGRSHAQIYLAVANDSSTANIIVDLAGGTLYQTQVSGSVTFDGTPTITSNGDGTYKVVCVINWPASQASIKWRIQSMNSTGGYTFAGDTSKGVLVKNTIKLWRVA